MTAIIIGAYFFLFAHDTAFRAFEELDDGLDFGAVGHLILDLVDDVKHAGLSVEEQTVGVGDVLLHLLVDAGLVHHRLVGTAVLDGLATCNDEWRDVLREGGTGLDHRQAPHTGVSILDGTRQKMAPLWISQSPAIFTP